MTPSQRKTKRRSSSSEEGAVMPKIKDAPRNTLARALNTFPDGRCDGIGFRFDVNGEVIHVHVRVEDAATELKDRTYEVGRKAPPSKTEGGAPEEQLGNA